MSIYRSLLYCLILINYNMIVNEFVRNENDCLRINSFFSPDTLVIIISVCCAIIAVCVVFWLLHCKILRKRWNLLKRVGVFFNLILKMNFDILFILLNCCNLSLNRNLPQITIVILWHAGFDNYSCQLKWRYIM